MNRIFTGIWAGLIATGPMTLSFFKFFEELFAVKRKPLPPSQLTATIENKFGMNPKSQTAHANMTMISHFLYGAGTGLLYSQTMGRMNGNAMVKGAMFGLGVWTASYLGWIPAMNLEPKAKKMNSARNSMMVISHLVWGLSLAYAEEQLRAEGKQMLGRRV